MAKGNKFSIHSFYCPICGQKTMDLPRRMSIKHEKFHRKKLYCPWCKKTLNQIEIKNDKEYYEFKEMFEKGEFENESKESLDYVRTTGVW